jgi:hypothetical protein
LPQLKDAKARTLQRRPEPARLLLIENEMSLESKGPPGKKAFQTAFEIEGGSLLSQAGS